MAVFGGGILKKAWKDFINDFKELKAKKGFIYKLPSIITGIRLICTILIPILFVLGVPTIAVISALVGSLTDALDGKIAKKYNATSNFGAKLDALCDKLFIGSLGISLIILLPIIGKLLTVLILNNEIIISKINCEKLAKGQITKTTQTGRVKMVIMCCAFLLGFLSILNPILTIPAFASLVGTIGSQIATIISYIKQPPMFKEQPKQKVKNPDVNLEIVEESKEKELQVLHTLKETLDKTEETETTKTLDFHL